MSWTTKTSTWQPPGRRDRPLFIAVVFFGLVAVFFLWAWYQYYVQGMFGRVLLFILGIVALLAPAVLTWRQASHAGRLRNLWSLLVLGGSALALFLPGRYLVLSRPIPTSSYLVNPGIYGQALTVTLVALIPLAMGAFPIVLYGLAIGQARPLAGIPPRPAMLAVWVAGTVICGACHFVSLLNPVVPPLIGVNRSNEVQLRLDLPPTIETEVVTAAWSKLIWRLGDGFPPGTTVVSAERDAVRLTVPAIQGWKDRLAQLAAPGIVEIVYTGETLLTPDTEVSTTLRPLADKSQTYETLFSGAGLQRSQHWSGMEIADVTVETTREGGAAIRLPLTAGTVVDIERRAGASENQNLALVLDNMVMAVTSMPIMTDGSFLIEGLSIQDAQLVAAIARYGSLPLIPTVDAGN